MSCNASGHKALFILCAGFAALLTTTGTRAQVTDEMAKALAQGDLFASKRKYELALDAYHKADKLARHNSAVCYLKLVSVERKLGDFSSALDDSKRAVKAAGGNNTMAVQAYVQRAALLTQMSGKPNDKKLREAEQDLRAALALEPSRGVTHFDLGYVLMKQERDAEGTAELRTALASTDLDEQGRADAQKFLANPIRARTPFAPDFSFITKENIGISNSTVRGKVVLLDFWGTWCPPCRESVPILKNLKKKYNGKSFQLVGVSSDNDEDVWKAFIEAQKMDWAEYIDLSGKVLQTFRIESFPTYIVLDKDGVIRFRQSGLGPTTEEDLEDAIGKALKKEPDPKLAAALAGGPEQTEDGQDDNVETASAHTTMKTPDSVASTANDAEARRSRLIEGQYAGGVYKNELLGMTYQLPASWIPAKPETLHASNQKTDAIAKAAILQQHPELTDQMRFVSPQIVLYASRRGEGDGQRLSPPCVRITAYPTLVDKMSLEGFEQTVQHMGTLDLAVLAQDRNPIGEARQFTVNGHEFFRADFERTSGARHIFQTFVQTLAGDFCLNIEFFATSKDELMTATESLKAMMIQEEDEE